MNRHTISGWLLSVRPTSAGDVTLARIATYERVREDVEVEEHEVAFYGAAGVTARELKPGEFVLVEGRAKYRRGRSQLHSYTFYRVESRAEPPGPIAALITPQPQGAQ